MGTKKPASQARGSNPSLLRVADKEDVVEDKMVMKEVEILNEEEGEEETELEEENYGDDEEEEVEEDYKE